MDRSPASGERNALRGYRWQYDQLASIVYDSLLDGVFQSLRLTDPGAGKVDDLVLITSTERAGHQFKSEQPPGTITFNDLIKPRRTRSGRPAPSWLKALGDGWLSLKSSADIATVSFVTNQLPSVADRVPLTRAEDDNNPQRSFAEFSAQVLLPLSSGALELDRVPALWADAIQRMQAELEFDQSTFATFLRALRLEFAAPDPLATRDSTRRGDILELSDALYRKVSNANDVVVLDRQQLLHEVGWTDRVRLRSGHHFPVDLDTYEPLDAPIDTLNHLLSATTCGHIAVVGPPGSGKSTLLTQSLMQTENLVIRYYAYVPGPGSTRTRLESRGFLHDVVLLLEQATNNRGHLLERSVDELRDALIDLFDVASKEFQERGRKTVIVVDGLDHVERDYAGTASLLQEIPRPEQVPQGIIFVLGTRTLGPLHPETRQNLESSGRIVDLQDHRLTRDAVLSICRRVGSVATLDANVHNAIALQAGGHPLALAYLLNLVADAESADFAIELVTNYPAYDGDIAQQYRAIWESLSRDPQELLATVARLRVPFELVDLADWFDPYTCREFRDHLRFLFRRAGLAHTFFHDSFRQFVVLQSSLSESSMTGDPLWDALYHERIADLCARASRPHLRWEELYHRSCAGQDFVHLASQESFREQTIAMRGSVPVREDLAIVLRSAALSTDMALLIDAILAKSEAESRWNVLEGIDVVGALLDADLPAEAVAYAGIHQGRTIPLHHAYRLASRLGLCGSADGRRVFDATEPELFDDAQFATHAGHENDVYEEWALAAPMYRPLNKILSVVEKLHPGGRLETEDFWHARQVSRFARVVDAVSDGLVLVGRTDDLEAVDELLTTLLAQHSGDDDDRVPLIDSVLRLIELRVLAASDATAAVAALTEGLALAKSSKLYLDTILKWAELALQYGRIVDAERLIARCPLDAQLATRDLGISADGKIGQRFRYWRIRHRLLRIRTPDLAETLLGSVPPSSGTPAGNHINPGAPAHNNDYEVGVARTIDLLVRTLASVAAATDENMRYAQDRLETVMLRTIHVTKRLRRRPRDTTSFGVHRLEMLQLLAGVTLEHGMDSAERLSQHVEFQIQDDASNWPNSVLLPLGQQLHSAGVTPVWYEAAVAEAEGDVTSNEIDLHSRLDDATGLVTHLAGLGRRDEARFLARRLVELAFGVGYRKDYQFDNWLDWFQRAVVGGLPEPDAESIELGRILTAAAPMTEGAPRDAAAKLPSILALRQPGSAVALFELMVRDGTVDHLKALSLLLEELIRQVGARPVLHNAIVDMATDVVARCSTIARPSLVGAIAAEVRVRLDAEPAAALRSEMRDRIDRDALPTTRLSWLAEIDSESMASQSAPGLGSDELELDDGSKLSSTEIARLVTNAASLIDLRQRSASHSNYRWFMLIDRLPLSIEELARLTETFSNKTTHRDAEVLVSLGRKWLQQGDRSAALRCASAALELAHDSSWGSGWGTARRDAHRLAIEAGGSSERERAWLDVAESVVTETWRADILLDGLQSIVEMLDPSISPTDIWPLIRAHLDGIASNLELSSEDPLTNQPLRWWLPESSKSVPRVDNTGTAAQALAVLLIDHASHLLWVVREPAIAIAARSLGRAFPELETTIATVLQAAPPDDIVEALGRIVSVADYGDARSPAVEQIHNLLKLHPSQYVRDLSPTTADEKVGLPARYRLQLPPSGDMAFGASDIGLGPYEDVIRLCAESAGLDEGQVVEHALLMMKEQSRAIPTDRAAKSAHAGAGMNFMMPYLDLLSARAVAGRIIKDFRSAGYLGALNGRDAEMLRSFDKGLLDVRPTWRPNTVPTSPPAGHDTTLDAWLTGITDRLNEYVAALENTDGLVIAARTQATVLNWTRAQEEFYCSIVVGRYPTGFRTAHPSQVRNKLKADLVEHVAGRAPTAGDALAVENSAMTFHQLDTFWISFAPWIAAHLGWVPSPEAPGTWLDAGGQLMVETVEWVDGWPGHGEPAFDDTEEIGVLVLATALGAEAIAQLGALTRTSKLHRRGRDRDSGTEPAAERSVRCAQLVN